MSVQPRILVVDDVEDNREILRARLESQGYVVDTAENGEAALAAVAANPPDLILLDVMMPRLDGIETVKLLKADTSLPFIPVILLTAKTDSKDVVAGLEAGAIRSRRAAGPGQGDAAHQDVAGSGEPSGLRAGGLEQAS